MSRSAPLLLSLLSLLSLLHLTSAGCYWYNGEDRNLAYNESNGIADAYQPCPVQPGASASMCCNSGEDTCEPNGMCYNAGYGIYWRESCSDPSWEDVGCIKLFINGTGAEDDVTITECTLGGGFCLGSQNFDCCLAGEGVYIVDGYQVPHNYNASTTAASTAASTATTSKSSSGASTSSPTSRPSPSPSPGPAGGLSTGAKAGIGVGVALGALLALGMVAWFLLRRRNRASAPAPTPAYIDGRSAAAPVEKDASWKRPAGPHEVHSDQHIARQELPGVQPGTHREGLAELGQNERG